MSSTMIVPMEIPFHQTNPITFGSTDVDHQDFMTTMNITNDELCQQLKSNLSQLQWGEIDFTAYGINCIAEHAPQLNQSIIIRVIVLSVMGFISLLGNIATIWNIRKNRSTRRLFRHNCSAIYALILHLSVADILVTFFCIIGEAAWSYTVEWMAGNITCKLMKILQMFSLYLSTNVLVLIGIDRWVAVKYPMKSKFLNTARFLVLVYGISLILSLPQGLIFRVVKGPFVEEFYQCVTFGFYKFKWQEQFYTCFTLVFMFIIPLLILVSSYISTFRTIANSERIFKLEETKTSSDHMRRTDSNRQKLIHKAKMKSLRISVVIVAAFIICWAPYYVMMLIFMFLEPDKRLSDDLQSGIFFFGMSNSLINPLIYGLFQYQPIKRRKQFLQRRDGSLHRSSTNATVLCRNLNNLNVAPKYSINSQESEWPKQQNQEEISLMSLEHDLKTLEERNNNNNAIHRKHNKISEHLSKFFKKKRNRPTLNLKISK